MLGSVMLFKKNQAKDQQLLSGLGPFLFLKGQKLGVSSLGNNLPRQTLPYEDTNEGVLYHIRIRGITSQRQKIGSYLDIYFPFFFHEPNLREYEGAAIAKN